MQFVKDLQIWEYENLAENHDCSNRFWFQTLTAAKEISRILKYVCLASNRNFVGIVKI